MKWLTLPLSTESENETTAIAGPNGKSYRMNATYFAHTAGFRIDLLEDGHIAASDNTSNASFRKDADDSRPLHEQMLSWGKAHIEQIKRCEVCGEVKVVHQLADYDLKYDELDGLEEICGACRAGIYNSRIAARRA